MRSTIRRLALVPGTLLAAGALVLGMASAAGATVTTTNWAGLRAGNGNWHFRYVEGTFTVPLHACTGDDYQIAGVHLGGKVDFFTLGVACNSSSGATLSGYYRYNNTAMSGSGTPGAGAVTGNNQIFASIYYDQSNNVVSLYEYDVTNGATLVNTFFTAGNAQFAYATAFGQIHVPQVFPPPAGTSIALVPFTGARATSLNGTKGSGLAGPWGVQNEEAASGAHVIAAAANANSNDSSFNVEEYGNA